MALLPDVNHFITLQDAIDLTTKCREEKTNILKPEYQNDNIVFTCETFNREAFDAVLRKNGCVGIRIYTGMDGNLKLNTVIVGVNENNEDILPENVNDNCIIEQGQLCPPFCPPPSPLNE